MKHTYTHESEKLNALLGKKVKVKFYDDDVRIGILQRSERDSGYYIIGNLEFRKSHVVKVVVYGK